MCDDPGAGRLDFTSWWQLGPGVFVFALLTLMLSERGCTLLRLAVAGYWHTAWLFASVRGDQLFWGESLELTAVSCCNDWPSSERCEEVVCVGFARITLILALVAYK